MTQVPFSLMQRILPQTTHQVTKKSGAALMKFILSATASQAMNLMIGSGPNVSSKRSLFSNEAGIVFRSSATPTPRTEIDIQRTGTMEEKPITMLVILAIMVGAVLVMAAVAHTSRSLEKKQLIQLGVGRKLHS
jgi:hypothetical protein